MMFLLYSLLILMIIVALILLAIPFFQKKNFKHYFFIAFLFTLMAFGIYQCVGDKSALHQWLTQGKQHYHLLETFEKLGGIDGAIARIQQKLNQNPDDVQGWVILGKLYLSKGDKEKASAAFKEAQTLLPDSIDIQNLYENSK